MAYLQRMSWMLGGGPTLGVSVVIVGLTGSGKSTLLRRLKPHEVSLKSLAPLTVGPYAETFNWGSFTFTAFQLGGETAGFGNPWEDLLGSCSALVILVDSEDRLLLPALHDYLLDVTSSISKRTPVVVLANKSDQSTALPTFQLTQDLGITHILRGRTWQCFPISSFTGDGLNDALDWVINQLRKSRRYCEVAPTETLVKDHWF